MKDSINYSSLLTAAHGIWAIPCVFIMRFIKPVVLIRIGTFTSDRIGHFSADAGQQFVMLNSKNDKTIDLYWLSKMISNKQWENMIRRNFPIYHWVKYLDIWNRFIPYGGKHVYPSSTTGSRDIKGLLHNSNIKMMEFLPDEDKKAKSWMRSKGWSDGEPFVCLLVRDSAYLTQDNLHVNTYDYTYHSYRDSDISTYIEAMEWLADSGVWVFRMGKIMNVPISSKHPKIIDYAFCPEKSDLLDIWLFANCDLCISTGSGPDAISDSYGRPMLLLNYLPITHMFSWSNSLHVPKRLYWIETNVCLSWSEYFDHDYTSTDDYKESGIKIVDLSSREILDFVKESWQKIDSTWVETEREVELKKKFFKIALQSNNFTKINDYIHPKFSISHTFLQSNQEMY